MSRKNNTDYRIEKKIEAVEPFISIKKTRTSTAIPTSKRSVLEPINSSGEYILLGEGKQSVWVEINQYNKQFGEMLDEFSSILDIFSGVVAGLSTAYISTTAAITPTPQLVIASNSLKTKINNLKGKLP